ncbi:hypothetical protein KP509_21G024600 [Ceratopteris richardii]|uniref:Fe2OG dioxygenase domain-containing protein n=1 Tax=Ceratopteris richardii TaxID=49495 RepID=A0A8T2S9I5_CERRI|nr:hypothetical protein KP509_21G024600 [Ceratopteris richardii]KAH7314861.1 hypothetical protein KP509_21G024600 [Ceratopteris richardii]
MPSLVASPLVAPSQSTSKALFHDTSYTRYFTPPSSILPDAYIWPEQDRPSSIPDDNEASSRTEIPIIDMADDEQTLIRNLANACESWGVFYIVNHGVPAELLNNVREKALELFSLPPSTKMRALRRDGSFEGFGKAPISKFFDSLMWSEGFTMMGYPTSSISDTTSKLCPDGNNKFRGVFEEFDCAARRVAGRLLRVIMAGLGVRHGDEEQHDVEKESVTRSALQLNYYAPCDQAHMTMGLPAHTDSTCLTLLHQGLVPGLEVLHPSRCSWTPVPPLSAAPSSLVVHVGDMLQVISNGKYKSIVHRAIVNKTKARLSIVSLCFPSSNATIAPSEAAVGTSKGGRSLYKPFKWEEFMQAKSKYFMAALDNFRC